MNATITDLWSMSATDLAEAIRARQVSSQEVIEAHLHRIETVNPSVNAVTAVLADQALQGAKAADRALARGAQLPPLHGVPFTVKENIDLLGTPTTQGLKALAGAYPTLDAPVVERLKAAGAIPIGRTNLPNLAVRWHCDSELYGPTMNPWDRSRTAGASSAGEAAAIATGMSPLGLGNDGLGSLRHPALDVLAGATWRDPWSVPAPLRGPEPAMPLRVALVVDPAGRGTVGQVRDGVRKAARALEDAGYAVEEVEPPSIEVAAKTLLEMLNTPDVRAMWQAGLPMMPADTRRFLAEFYEVAGDPGSVATLQSFATRQSLLRAWGEFQETYPLVVGPICTDVPFEAGTDLDEGRVAETIRSMRMALAVNALGLPAVALPVGVGDGLPQSVQVIGPRYREDLCLDAAAAIEDRLGILTPIDPR